MPSQARWHASGTNPEIIERIPRFSQRHNLKVPVKTVVSLHKDRGLLASFTGRPERSSNRPQRIDDQKRVISDYAVKLMQ